MNPRTSSGSAVGQEAFSLETSPVAASSPAKLAELARGKRTGIALMVLSAGLLAVGDATAKWLTASYPIGEIIFLRGLIILALLVAIRFPHRLSALLPHRLAAQLRRAVFFVLATFLMIWGLSLLPLPTVSAISFAAPIIVTALAPWLLGEAVGRARWLAVCAGFLGVLLIVAPFGATWSWALLIPLGAALAQALRDIATRQVVETETNESVVFVTIGGTVLVGALSAPFGWIDPPAWGWVMPSAWDCALLLFLSLAHGGAYLMQVGAFRAAEAAFLAPFKYSFLLWAIVVAFAVWGHVPDLAVLVGAGIIAGSGIVIWYREVGMRERHA
jgi:drug/metabolite transporter (DMT)-like permease